MPLPHPPSPRHADMVNALVHAAGSGKDHPIRRIRTGSHLCLVQSRGCGLASLLPGTGAEELTRHMPPANSSALDLAARLSDNFGTFPASLSLASLNSLLPPPGNLSSRKGQDVIRSRGQGRRVVVVGHFPFVDRMRGDFASFHVLERTPGPGDLDASTDEAREVLARADFAAVTATTLINGTLGALLSNLGPDCFVMLLGPSTPLAPVLFDFGIHALAGSLVPDPDTVANEVAGGTPFRFLRGVEHVLLERDWTDSAFFRKKIP